VWTRCFDKCHAVLSQANEIFSSVDSPTLCTEILQETRARDYVQHLQEIFHLHKRIHAASDIEPTTARALATLGKQIVVLWTNLQSFFSAGHLHLVGVDDDVDYAPLTGSEHSSAYCSVCLVSTVALESVVPSSTLNCASLTFAGRVYHASCANFYLNLIDGILPSLRRTT
jgi:hypothetical protein